MRNKNGMAEFVVIMVILIFVVSLPAFVQLIREDRSNDLMLKCIDKPNSPVCRKFYDKAPTRKKESKDV